MTDPWSMTVLRSSSTDEAEVRRSLSLLVDPGHCVQIQSLPSGRWRQVAGRDMEALMWAVRDFSDEKGVYLSLNPFRGPLDHPLKTSDILTRRWLLIDPDAVKAEKDRDSSTTEGEKEQARLVTEQVREFLRSQGWPDPIFVDSGNNWQLLYRIDLPADRLAQQMLSKVLKVLAEQFDTDGVKIDRKVHDAKRICKIPGTWVRKGDNTVERPWRMARLVSVPVALAPVDVELLKQLAGLSAAKPAPEPAPMPFASIMPPDPWAIPVGGDDKANYARAAFEGEIGRIATARQPGRNGVLYESALKLGTLVAAGQLDKGEVERALAAAGHACGLGQDGDPEEVERAIRNGMTVGLANPRQIPERKKGAGPGATHVVTTAPVDPSEPLVIRASTVTPKPVRWLWEGRIPKGFITVFAGRTGLGKSFVTCDIAARLTRGIDWPDSQGECMEAGNVLLISEDSFEYVLTPRLIEMQADMDRVFYLSWAAMARYQLADTAMLTAAFEQAGQPVLIAIDPPTNFLGGRDEHKNAEIRQILMNLVTWLDGRDTSCTLITHVNKNTGRGTEALSRVIGSVAWTTTSRVAHAFVADPDNEGQALFIPMKSNLGALPKGLSYRIAKTENFARIEWLGEVDTTADEAMSGEKSERKQTKTEGAVDWLRERFAEKSEWTSDEILKTGESAGFKRDQLFAAKKSLGFKAKKSPEHNGAWIWRSENTVDSSTVRQFDDCPF